MSKESPIAKPNFDNIKIDNLEYIINNVGKNREFHYYKISGEYNGDYFHITLPKNHIDEIRKGFLLKTAEPDEESFDPIERLAHNIGSYETEAILKAHEKVTEASLESFQSKIYAIYNLDEDDRSENIMNIILQDDTKSSSSDKNKNKITLRELVKETLIHHRQYSQDLSSDPITIDQVVVRDSSKMEQEKDSKISVTDLASEHQYSIPDFGLALYDQKGRLVQGATVVRPAGNKQINFVTFSIPAEKNKSEAPKNTEWGNVEFVDIADTGGEKGRPLYIKTKYDLKDNKMIIEKNSFQKTSVEYEELTSDALESDEPKKAGNMKIIAASANVPEMSAEKLAQKNKEIAKIKNQEKRDYEAKLQKEEEEEQNKLRSEFNSIEQEERSNLQKKEKELDAEALESEQKARERINTKAKQDEQEISKNFEKKEKEVMAQIMKILQELDDEKEKEEKKLKEINQNKETSLQEEETSIRRRLAEKKNSTKIEIEKTIGFKRKKVIDEHELSKKQKLEKQQERKLKEKEADFERRSKIKPGNEGLFSPIRIEREAEPDDLSLQLKPEIPEEENKATNLADFLTKQRTDGTINPKVLLAILDTIKTALDAFNSSVSNDATDPKKTAEIQKKQNLSKEALTLLKQITENRGNENNVVCDYLAGKGKILSSIEGLTKALSLTLKDNKDALQIITGLVNQSVNIKIQDNGKKFVSNIKEHLSQNKHEIAIDLTSRKEINSLLEAVVKDVTKISNYYNPHQDLEKKGGKSRRSGLFEDGIPTDSLTMLSTRITEGSRSDTKMMDTIHGSTTTTAFSGRPKHIATGITNPPKSQTKTRETLNLQSGRKTTDLNKDRAK